MSNNGYPPLLHMIWHSLLVRGKEHDLSFMPCFPRASPVISQKQKSDDFIAGQWNSGQMVPACVTATTQAGNVKASHPRTAENGGNVTHVHAHTRHIHRAKIHASFLWSSHYCAGGISHSPMLEDRLISSGLRYQRRSSKACWPFQMPCANVLSSDFDRRCTHKDDPKWCGQLHGFAKKGCINRCYKKSLADS